MSLFPRAPKLARLHRVPKLPPHYLPRKDVLARIKQKLLAADASIAITGRGRALGIHGIGGIGKTVLAAAIAYDVDVRKAFPDGIYWLTIGQIPSVLLLQGQLLQRLGVPEHSVNTVQEGKDALRKAFATRRALLVVDDVWTVAHAGAFSVTVPPARLLITTRNDDVLVGFDAEEHRVDVLSPSDALKMLADWVGQQSPDKLPTEAAEVARECGYLPLALAMIGAMIRSKPSSGPTSALLAWKDALTRLRRADLGAIKMAFPDYPYPDLLRAIEVSVEASQETDRKRYLDLGVFPEDVPIPEGPLRILWNTDEIDTRACMARLRARSLAMYAADETSLILHDLQRDLIRKRREGQLPGLHLRLVQAWDALPKLPDAYAWQWVGYHMMNADRKNSYDTTSGDFAPLDNGILFERLSEANDTGGSEILDDFWTPRKDDCRLQRSLCRESLNILMVEDDTFFADDCGEYLNGHGFSVWHCDNPDSALRVAKARAFDAVVIDIRMGFGTYFSAFETSSGRRTGVRLASELVQLIPNIKIVALTRSEDALDAAFFEATESCAFLSKAKASQLTLAKTLKRLIMNIPTDLKSFIVHGHDRHAVLDLKNYLQNTLGLPEPVILAEQPSRGMTAIEKFEYYSKDADLVFALFTPDDPTESSKRARQSVVFEYGYFLGYLGRSSARVFLLYKRGAEIPSDLSGVIYIDVTDGIAAAGERLRTELGHLFP
jgi:predicted nucleotide-binding protein